MYYLYANTENKWTDILPWSNNMNWTSDTGALGTEFNFDSLIKINNGTHVVFKVDKVIIFQGVVITTNRKKNSNAYTCLDYSWYLNKSEVSIFQCNKVSASNAIVKLCNQYGVKCNCLPLKTNIKKIYKDQVLNEIIDDILDQAHRELGDHCYKEMQGNTLVIQKIGTVKVPSEYLISSDLTLTSSIEDLKNKIVVISNTTSTFKRKVKVGKKVKTKTEKTTANRTLATAQGSNIKTYGTLQETILIDGKINAAQARNIANNKLKQLNKTKNELTFTLANISQSYLIKAYKLINVVAPSMGLNGWYRVKSASHSMSNNSHKVNITIEW